VYLYALWQGTATVQYDANGGSGAPAEHGAPMDSSGTVSFTIPSTKPTRDGYTFIGWDKGAAYFFQPGEKYYSNAGSGKNITIRFYAQWESTESEIVPPTTDVTVPVYYRPMISGSGSLTQAAILGMTLRYEPSYPITELGFVVTGETDPSFYHDVVFTTIPVSGEHQYRMDNVPEGVYYVYGYVKINGKIHKSYPLTLSISDPSM